MSKLVNSKKNLFLLELMISISLFMLLLIVGLLFFIKAHKLTQKTSELHEAVNICSNIAAVYEAGDGSFEAIHEAYDCEIEIGNQLVIHFDSNFRETKSTINNYYVIVTKASGEEAISSIDITFYSDSKEALYSLQAYQYTPLTVKEAK